MITNKDFIKELATRTGLSQKAIHTMLSALPEVIVEHLKEGEVVKLCDGITFTSVDVVPHECINPQTGEKMMTTKTGKKAKVRFGKTIKEGLLD